MTIQLAEIFFRVFFEFRSHSQCTASSVVVFLRNIIRETKKLSFSLNIEGEGELNKTLASHGQLRPENNFFSHKYRILKNVQLTGASK